MCEGVVLGLALLEGGSRRGAGCEGVEGLLGEGAVGEEGGRGVTHVGVGVEGLGELLLAWGRAGKGEGGTGVRGAGDVDFGGGDCGV